MSHEYESLRIEQGLGATPLKEKAIGTTLMVVIACILFFFTEILA